MPGTGPGRWLGQSDSPLAPRGVEQSLAYADVLARLIPDGAEVALQCSPLQRARHTATLIGDRLGLEPEQHQVSPLLAEHAFGLWEGLTEEEIERDFPGAQAKRHRDHWTYIVPGGESYQQLHRRACAWLGSLEAAPFTIVVTHAKTSRTLRGAYLGLEPGAILSFKHPQDRIFVLKAGEIATVFCGRP